MILHLGSSTATAYLTTEVLSRPNLTVASSVVAVKMLLDKSGDRPRAVGVEVSTGPTATRFSIMASREVILSAGAIGTPHLLLLSGIGPAEELAEHHIQVVHELPAVGKNLQDVSDWIKINVRNLSHCPSKHVSTGPLPFRTLPGLTYDHILGKFSSVLALLRWLVFGTGPLSSMGMSSAAFVRSTDPT